MSARGGFCAEVCPGGHIGPPLRGTGGVWEPTEISVKRSLSPAGRDGARPLRGTGGVRGGVRLGCGFRQPNFGTKFGASVMVIGPYAPRGTGERHAESSCPTGGCGEPPRLPWGAAHSGASAAWSQGMGKNRSMDHPQMGHQRRTIPQSRPLAVPAPFTQGSLWRRGRRIAASALRASSQ